MIKSHMARILATVSLLPLALVAVPSAAQSTDTTPVRTFGTASAQFAAADVVEVGITDVVERTALGTLEQTTRNLRITDTIFFNERIATGADSSTRVSFLDDSSLSLGPSSEVIIDRFVYDPNQGTGELALSLTAGVFRFASGTLDSENYSIDTPVGTIGVRGTVIEVALECAQNNASDCDIMMDVVSGWTTFDRDGEETITPRGSRMEFRPALSPVVEVAALPPGAEPLPGVETMGEGINESTVELMDGALPPGVTFGTATPAQLAAAAVQLATDNPRLGDLIVEAVGLDRDDALGAVASALMTNVPDSTRRVVGALANIQASNGGIIPSGGGGSPFGDDDRRDNPLDDEEVDEDVPDDTPPDDDPPDDDPPDDDPPDDDPPDDDPPDDDPPDNDGPRSDRLNDVRDRLEDIRDGLGN